MSPALLPLTPSDGLLLVCGGPSIAGIVGVARAGVLGLVVPPAAMEWPREMIDDTVSNGRVARAAGEPPSV